MLGRETQVLETPLLWMRPVGGSGFQLATVNPTGERLLALRPGATWETRDAMAEPALYRVFASLDGSDEAFVWFANGHGALTIGALPGPAGEPLPLWRSCHRWMQHIVTLIDAHQREGAAYVAGLVREDGEGFTIDGPSRAELGEVAPGPLPWRVQYAPQELTDRVALLAEANAILPGDGRYALSCLVLADHINEQLDRELWRVVRPTTAAMGSMPGRGHLCFQSRTLWGAMVLQLYLAVVQGRVHRRCPACGQWFECGGTARADKLACSSLCRTRLSRQRRKAS